MPLGASYCRRKQGRIALVSNDLGFLIIFIVLPTALIVSGFWLILIVRGDTRRRGFEEASTTLSSDEVDHGELRDAPVANEEQPTPLVAGSSARKQQGDEAQQTKTDTEEEPFWTPESDVVPPDVDEEPEIALEPAHDPIPEPVIVAPRPVDLDDTASLPGDLVETDDDENIASEDAADDASDETADDGRQQRRPAARMVPSTDNVLKRTGQQVRSAPAINRSNVRDEDSVESPDGS